MAVELCGFLKSKRRFRVYMLVAVNIAIGLWMAYGLGVDHWFENRTSLRSLHHNSRSMQNYRPILAFAILLALAGSFGLAVLFRLLRARRTIIENLKAVDVWPQIRDAGFNFSGLLYGIWKDYSATQRGMIVKDCRDQQVGGSAIARAGGRAGSASRLPTE